MCLRKLEKTAQGFTFLMIKIVLEFPNGVVA